MHTTALTLMPAVNRMVLGFYETNRNGHRAIAHGGDTFWFHSDLHLFIDDGIGIFISMNSPGKDGAAGPIRTAVFEQFADRYLPAPDTATPLDRAVAYEHAHQVAGQYESSRHSVSNFFGADRSDQPQQGHGQSRHDDHPAIPHRPQRRAEALARDQALRLAGGGRQERGAGPRWRTDGSRC